MNNNKISITIWTIINATKIDNQIFLQVSSLTQDKTSFLEILDLVDGIPRFLYPVPSRSYIRLSYFKG